MYLFGGDPKAEFAKSRREDRVFPADSMAWVADALRHALQTGNCGCCQRIAQSWEEYSIKAGDSQGRLFQFLHQVWILGRPVVAFKRQIVTLSWH
jgi:hypothetical protein